MKNENDFGYIGRLKNRTYDDRRHFQLNGRDQSELQKRSFYVFFKRFMDVVFSAMGLVFLSPIMLWVGLKIYREDPDQPVIFTQERMGQDGKPFTMYKFRSMHGDAEKRLEELLDKNEVEGPMFKIKEDPRVTEFGKFIRRTSLDEFPQLVNVIKGEMSLIGPRPALKREVIHYTAYDRQRLLVKPGCSGLWQVSGRSEVHFDEMVAFDIAYIQKRSFWYDMWLIMKTIRVMIKPDGAY
ncbi:sugar transferase [Enterococcus sp. AZ196]|uniref:sugar transferase n=1 Tax=Enterococcus sp. AZ196 TaxID=2774659 RepID=UPI003D2D25C1